MSTSSPDNGYHHGNLRETLVAAALDRLQVEGPSALGLRELARGIGVSPSAPYRHFTDRQALLEAVAAEGFRRFSMAMNAAAADKPETEQLEAMARAYVRFAIDAPHLFRLMFSTEIEHRRDPALAAAAKTAYATLAAAAAREDVAASAKVAITAWAFVHGLSVLLIDQQILGVSTSGADALVEQLAHRLIAGLRATREQ